MCRALGRSSDWWNRVTPDSSLVRRNRLGIQRLNPQVVYVYHCCDGTVLRIVDLHGNGIMNMMGRKHQDVKWYGSAITETYVTLSVEHTNTFKKHKLQERHVTMLIHACLLLLAYNNSQYRQESLG